MVYMQHGSDQITYVNFRYYWNYINFLAYLYWSPGDTFFSCVLRSTKPIILFLTDTSGLNTRSKVISLQESFTPDTSSYARWRGNITAPLTDATICYRIKIFYYRPEVIVFSYINTKGDKIRTGNKIVAFPHQIILSILFEQFIKKLTTSTKHLYDFN